MAQICRGCGSDLCETLADRFKCLKCLAEFDYAGKRLR